jgi:hypothetical protein
MGRALAFVLLVAGCAPQVEGDSCQRAAGFLHECGVSLPLLADGPCVGVRLEVADCVLAFSEDCRQAAELPAHMEDCLADLGDDDLPELPPPGEPPPAGQPESGPAACADGDDNDGDGFIDCHDVSCDPACSNETGESGDAACADGTDNDGDGFIDCDDFDCSRDVAVSVCPHEVDDAACADGTDNDSDGFIDCDDFDCRVPEVTVCA